MHDMYTVYMLKNVAGRIYIGMTENIGNRLRCHNTGRGARFTKSDGGFWMVFREQYATLAEARQREVQIKKWRRNKKEMLIERFRKGLTTQGSGA